MPGTQDPRRRFDREIRAMVPESADCLPREGPNDGSHWGFKCGLKP